jgi:hypothetical protein
LTTLSSHPVIFAENKWKCLSMNNLHTKLSFPSQAQSSPIKVNQGILLCSPHRTNGPISPPFAEAFHFAFPGRQSLGDGGCILHSAFLSSLHLSKTQPMPSILHSAFLSPLPHSGDRTGPRPPARGHFALSSFILKP